MVPAFRGCASAARNPGAEADRRQAGPDGIDDVGDSLVAAGLIIAAYRIRINLEIIGNVIAKMIAQPIFMVVLVVVFSVSQPLAREAILMCAIPTSGFATLLAPGYGVYETESASTLVLSAISMIAMLPVAITLTA